MSNAGPELGAGPDNQEDEGLLDGVARLLRSKEVRFPVTPPSEAVVKERLERIAREARAGDTGKES